MKTIIKKAIIKLDVPDWQIGQDVTVYFPDTMMKKGECEAEYSDGCWIKHLDKYVCSFCHIRSQQASPYCAWCGTKMLNIVVTDA